MLDYDFFELLDSVTIARSRKHIQKYYDTTDIGTFPKRNPPLSIRPGLTDLDKAITYNEIFEQLNALKLCIYTPTHYILPSRIGKYTEKYDAKKVSGELSQSGRETGLRRLMAINLMKRMESSVYAFRRTLHTINAFIKDTINEIEEYEKSRNQRILVMEDFSNMDFDGDEEEDDAFTIGRKVQIDIGDMDYTTWKRELKSDEEIFDLLIAMVEDIDPDHDEKLKTLFDVVDKKQIAPINPGNKKSSSLPPLPTRPITFTKTSPPM